MTNTDVSTTAGTMSRWFNRRNVDRLERRWRGCGSASLVISVVVDAVQHVGGEGAHIRKVHIGHASRSQHLLRELFWSEANTKTGMRRLQINKRSLKLL